MWSSNPGIVYERGDEMAKKIVRMTFPEELIQEPIVYRLGHDFDLVTSVFRASVGEKDAWIVLALDGSDQEIKKAIDFLTGVGIRIEEKSEADI